MRILVIVESPNKVKKIQEYLNQIKEPVPREALICPSDKPVGDHNQNFVVQATVGHLLDLNKEKGALGIDLDNQFAPDYKPIAHQARVIADLKKSAKQADQIWIASDQDQEGEFIGYSLCRILSLPVQTTRRLMFNEITLSAIKTAVENPTTLNLALIDAQKCRRIIDRLIGFQLSRLARRVNAGISVGRVKTVLVRLVADRQSTIDQFKTDSHFRLTGNFKLNNQINFQAYAIQKLTDSAQAHAYLEKCLQTPDLFRFQKTTDQIQLQKAPPPFKTASLQKDGSRQLKMSPKAVLSLAQKLYESGLISYPRTDTTNLPIEKQMEIQQLIESKYGPEYYQNNAPPEPIAKNKSTVKAKANNTQGAHSAIYPTDLKVTSVPEVDNSDQLNRVYQMIYRRTIASQMKPARYRVLKLYFTTNLESPNTIDWQSNFKALVFPGYLIVYQKSEPESQIENEAEIETSADQTLLDQLSKLTAATPIHYQQIQAKQQWSQPPTYYDSAGVLDQLEKHGIGRPSTWGHMLEECLEMNFIQKVPIIELDPQSQTCLTITPSVSNQTIKETQNHVQPPIQRNRIKTTELGQMSIDFVREHFDNIFNYEFTGQLETRLNQIEQQTENWVNVTNDLYQMYRPKMEVLSSKDSTNQIKDLKSEKRELGIYQGQPVLAYYGRYGPVLQIGKYSKAKSAKSTKSKSGDDEASVQYYPIKEPYQWQTIQLEDLPNLMTVPRELGKINKQAVILKQSQYGYYLYYQKRTYSLKPEYFQSSIDNVEDQALVTQHLDQLDFEKIRDDLTRSDDQSVQVGPYHIRPGPYGPYFKAGNLNISVPASYRQNIENITLEQCQEWIANRRSKKKF